MPPRTPAIRPAARKDLGTIQALARRTIDARYRSFLGDEDVDQFISGASDEHIESHFDQGRVHCMEVSGEVVGIVILEGPTLDLMMIDVDHQRQGWGRVLLAQAEGRLFDQYEEIRLESFVNNHAANAFYEACGWSATGPLESEGPAKVEFKRYRRTPSTS